MSSRIRNIRINDLYNKAKTGKYTWKELRVKARELGVSEPTVTSYLRTVEDMLRKAGRLK